MTRQHRKSRLGCQTCKRRKIKCDETRPGCSNCVRFGVECDFLPLSPTAGMQSLSRVIEAPQHRRRGRPRSDWTSWTEQLRSKTPCHQHQQQEDSQGGQNEPAHPISFGVKDVEVFHQYMTATAFSLADGSSNGLWLRGAPKLGFQHPCILSFIMALSAHHLAWLSKHDSSEHARWKDLAGHHSTTALQSAKLLLGTLDAENSPALYIMSTLVCFTAFANGPTSQSDILLTAEEGHVSWLSLLRGVRLIVSTTGWASIFSGPLEEFKPRQDNNSRERSESSGREHAAAEDSVSPGSEDWRLSLNRVSHWTEASCTKESARNGYKHELNSLAGCFEQTFGTGRHAGHEVHGELQVVISWIYQLEDVYIEGLRLRDPTALVILGHFCVLFRTLRRFWFTEGWATHVLRAVLSMSETSRAWLSWPMQYLEIDAVPSASPHSLATASV